MLLGIQQASLPCSYLISSSSQGADADADADEGQAPGLGSPAQAQRTMPRAARAPGRSCHLDLNLNLCLSLTCFDLAPWLCFDVRCFPSLLAAAASTFTFTITITVVFCKRSELRYLLRRRTAAWEKAEPWKRVEARRAGNAAALCVSGLRQVWLESGEAMLTVQTQVRSCRR
jgi:hypothetical protein